MWWTMKSTPRSSIQRAHATRSSAAEIVAHHLDAEVAAGVDDAADRRLVGAPHHDDEAGARLRHHLRFEVAAVHRLQVRDDRMIGKPRAELLDRAEAFGEEQGRAGLEPVDAGVDRDRGRLERLVERRQVERDLNDRERELGEIHGRGEILLRHNRQRAPAGVSRPHVEHRVGQRLDEPRDAR